MMNQFSELSVADVVIVGGGVIGLTIARALAKRGARDVVLIEKEHPGLEASWAAAGILGPQAEADEIDDFFQLACASRDLYPAFADSLKEETGMDVEVDYRMRSESASRGRRKSDRSREFVRLDQCTSRGVGRRSLDFAYSIDGNAVAENQDRAGAWANALLRNAASNRATCALQSTRLP